jgi:hypothetical protein
MEIGESGISQGGTMDRNNVLFQLVGAIDQANEKYLTGNLSAEDWQAELADIDRKLRVLGLALAPNANGRF